MCPFRYRSLVWLLALDYTWRYAGTRWIMIMIWFCESRSHQRTVCIHQRCIALDIWRDKTTSVRNGIWKDIHNIIYIIDIPNGIWEMESSVNQNECTDAIVNSLNSVKVCVFHRNMWPLMPMKSRGPIDPFQLHAKVKGESEVRQSSGVQNSQIWNYERHQNVKKDDRENFKITSARPTHVISGD